MQERGGLTVTVLLGTLGLAACSSMPPRSLATLTAPPPTIPAPEGPATPTCFQPLDILPVAFMPDGPNLIVRSEAGIQIIDLDAPSESDFIQSAGPIFAAAISPDGQTLAWSLQDGSIQLVRISDQRVIANLVGHSDPVYDLLFSPTGERIYSASHDSIVRVWGLDGTLLESVAPGVEVLGLGLSPDSSMLATIPSDGAVRVWDVAEGRKVRELGGTGGYDTSDAHFSSDGRYLAADLATGLFLWRISDGELLWKGPSNSMAIAFSPDGRFLAYSDIDNGNKVLLASPDAPRVASMLGQMAAPIWELFFSPDGSLLAATDGSEIRIWQVDDARIRYVGEKQCP
jgi:WD40 repeat protein